MLDARATRSVCLRDGTVTARKTVAMDLMRWAVQRSAEEDAAMDNSVAQTEALVSPQAGSVTALPSVAMAPMKGIVHFTVRKPFETFGENFNKTKIPF